MFYAIIEFLLISPPEISETPKERVKMLVPQIIEFFTYFQTIQRSAQSFASCVLVTEHQKKWKWCYKKYACEQNILDRKSSSSSCRPKERRIIRNKCKTKNALINQTLTKINHINDEYLIIINKFKQSKLDTLVFLVLCSWWRCGMERNNRTG